MSTVFLHVGQAGCQIGEAIWPSLFQERTGPEFFSSRSLEGDSRLCPRAILVDAEPKVVDRLLTPNAGYTFDPTSAVTAQSGRGGNFALGYTGGRASTLDGREELWAQAMQVMRMQTESCHGAHLGTLMTYSLGGGTGSGLGSRLLEEVRDLYPKIPLLVAPVLPISSGENPMQCYNVVLALSWLQDLADGVVLYENDALMALAEAESADAQHETTSLASMNSIIARDLIPHLCPEQICDFGELLQTISPLPSHKFAQIFSAGLRQRFNYESETTTKLIMDSLRRLPRSPRNSQNLFSARCVVRGVLEVSQQLKLELLERLGGAMPIKSAPIDLQTSPQPLKTSPSSRVSIVMNWRRITKVFRDVYHQAQQKYASRMFLHWYENFGFGADVFAEAFETLGSVVKSYE